MDLEELHGQGHDGVFLRLVRIVGFVLDAFSEKLADSLLRFAQSFNTDLLSNGLIVRL